MKRITLILPGLIWPARAVRAAASGLDVPGLSALSRFARIERLPAASKDALLLDESHLDPKHAALAWLRAQGDQLDPSGPILCADPVHLAVSREGLVLHDASQLDITAEEAAALITALNDTSPDIGCFECASNERWYLRPASPTPPQSHPLAAVIGRRIDNYLPGEPHYRRLLNEIQMLFHNHPVNTDRASRGEPVINSLWIWGEGTPSTRDPHASARPITSIISNDPLARGIASAAGASWEKVPLRFDSLAPSEHTLIELDALAAPALALALEDWQEALRAVDRAWLAPLAQRVSQRTLTVDILTPGDHGAARIHCLPGGRLRWFSRPVPIETFFFQALCAE